MQKYENKIDGLIALIKTNKIIFLILICFFALVFFMFCNDRSWREEVLLSDGRIVIVERKTIRESGGDEWVFNPSGSKPKDHVISFDDHVTRKRITWISTKHTRGRWPEHPMVLDIENGKYFVITSFSLEGGCDIYLKYIFDDGTWIEKNPQKYVLVDNVWVENTRSEKVGPRKANLLAFDFKSMPGMVDINLKNLRNSDSKAKLFNKIPIVQPYCY